MQYSNQLLSTVKVFKLPGSNKIVQENSNKTVDIDELESVLLDEKEAPEKNKEAKAS